MKVKINQLKKREIEGKKFGLLIPELTVFIANFCIMVLEIVASRLIARYLGVSLYTWTSVIGVVLAGISVGSYFGGRVADRFHPAKSLFILFHLAAIGCLATPVLNQLLENWLIFLTFSWTLRIITHVALAFFLPSVLLGMVSPVVARYALNQGVKTGRTLGNIYAWAAAGSILGTFVTGFLLIATLRTVAIIWVVAGILAIMGILYGLSARRSFSSAGRVTAFIFSFILLSVAFLVWVNTSKAHLLSSDANSLTEVIYEKDSQYAHIKVEFLKNLPSVRYLVMDTLLHSKVFMDDPADIEVNQYPYIKLFGTLTRYFIQDKKKLHFLFLGGGGYVLPRYLAKVYPNSHIEVVEIDPAVTETAIRYLGLPRENPFQIHHLDAHNYINELVRKKRKGINVPEFDFIYGDTFNVFSVPYQLTTYEFNEKLRLLLSAQGIYLLNLIDSFYAGEFVTAVLNTLKKTFPYVYVFSEEKQKGSSARANFIVLASLSPLDMRGLFTAELSGFHFLDNSTLESLKGSSRGIILTDDYAPVENLLQPVQKVSGQLDMCNKLLNRGNSLAQKNPDKAMDYYKESVRIRPDYAMGYLNIGTILALQKKFKEATTFYRKVLEIDPEFAEAHYCLGNVFLEQGMRNEAIGQFSMALKVKPDYPDAKEALDMVLDKK